MARRGTKAPGQASAARLAHYRKLILEFERATRVGSGEPLGVAEFCATSGISRRTLLRAVQAVHGVSVHRHLQAMRLVQARTMLLWLNAETVTVAQIANRCSFHQLGRFSVLYRKTIGESPSQTLNQSRARKRQKV
jgi:transcriptional regulator GlxA family with amidase domain